MPQRTIITPLSEPRTGIIGRAGNVLKLNFKIAPGVFTQGQFLILEIGTPRLRTMWEVQTGILIAEPVAKFSAKTIGNSRLMMEIGLGVGGLPQTTDIFDFGSAKEPETKEESRRGFALEQFAPLLIPHGQTLQLFLAPHLSPPPPSNAELINYEIELYEAQFLTNVLQTSPSERERVT